MMTLTGSSVLTKFLKRRNLSDFKLLAFLILIISPFAVSAQTTTRASGYWSTSTNWTSGVPNGSAIVNHSMTLDVSINASGSMTFNAPVTDPVDGVVYNLTLGTNSSAVDINANVTIGGYLYMDQNSSSLIVRNGDTLTIGEPGGTLTSTFKNGPSVTVEAGGVLIFNGNVDANQTTAMTIDGELIINGNYSSANSVGVSGAGTMYVTGSITSSNSSTVFGSQNDCSPGPCSGNSLCTTNTITPTSQYICTGQSPSAFTVSNPSGFTFQWQMGTVSASGTFTDISGATNSNYTPGTLTTTTWFRRKAIGTGCTSISVPAKVNVITGPASVSILANASVICSGGKSVTFTATPTNGASNPTYQWNVNGVNVGSASTTSTYTYTVSAADQVKCIMTSGLACVSGSPATSNTITMTIISSSGSWSGGTSTSWTTNSNWCSGSAPTSSDNVTINSGVLNMPTTSSGTPVANDVTINSGATLTISRDLTISGNLVVNSGGKLVINSGYTVTVKKDVTNNGTISGSGTLTLTNSSSTAHQISGSGVYSSILELNNTAGATVSGSVTVSGSLKLTAGTLTSNGNLTIDLSTGAIGRAGSGSITGNITLAQKVTSSKYHYLSTPFLTGSTVADWDDDVTIKSGVYTNLYYYNEANTSTVNTDGWTSITSTATALTPLKGYALYFDGPVTVDMTGTYSHGTAASNVNLTNTSSGDATVDGWNLVGNPYPSAIDWDASSGWTKSGIDDAIYCWDAPNNRYTSYVSGTGTNGGSRYIAPMQGYWVKVTNVGSKNFGCTNIVRVIGVTQTFFKMAAITNELRLTASTDTYSDETVVKVVDGATDDFDSYFDGYKLMNEESTPSLYTIEDDVEYSVNSISDTTTESTIPLYLKANKDGEYTIYASEIADFDNSYEVILEDTVLDISQDLRVDPAYSFMANTTDSAARFLIHLRKSALSAVNQPSNSSSNVIIRGIDHMVSVDFLNPTSNTGYIGIFNTMGRSIAEVSSADIVSGKYQIALPGESGIYIVKVAVGANVFTKKVFLK